MKRFLHIPLCAAALTAMLASCENTVEVIYMDENEPILVMNAMLEQDDSLHYVYVCLSEGPASRLSPRPRCGAASTAEPQ